MKRIILFVLLIAAIKVAGQTTGYLRYDTVKIMKQGGSCELYIINKTKDSLGLLTNVGGGLTQFKRSKALNDSMIIIGNDTLKILGRPGGNQTFQQVLNNGSALTENENITLADSLEFTSGWVIIDSLRLRSLQTKTDTTTNKPIAVDASGNVVKMASWPGTGVIDGDKGDITVSSAGTIWTIDNNAVTDAKIRQSAGLSVIGRSANSTGNVADITAASDHQVLRRFGTSIGFGAINLASTNAVTGVLPIGNIDTGTIKHITSRRTGVAPTIYPGATAIIDTAGRVRYAEAVRNNLGSHNGVTDTTAFGGAAAYFKGDNALIAPSNYLFEPGNQSFTIAAWARLSTINNINNIIAAVDDNRTKRGSRWLLGYVGFGTDKLQFQVEECCHLGENDLATWPIASSVPVSAGQWYFVVGQYDQPGGKVKIWVNMVKDSLIGVPAINTTKTPFSIGGLVDDWDTTGLSEPASYWNGAIKSVGYWNRLLDSTELATLYNNITAPLPPPGLNPGTMTNGATYSADVPAALSANVNSGSYDGTNDKTQLGSGVTLAAGASSISCWFKADAFGGVTVGQLASANAYIRVLNSTTIRVQTNVTGTFKDYTVPTMSTGTWYNLIITRDGSNLTHVYLDGTESSSGGQSQTDPLTIDQVAAYWDGLNGLMFDGKISDLRIYNSILSGADITAIQTNSATTATPVLWYKINEGSGTTVIDYGTAAAPRPFRYSELPSNFLYEKPNTFVSWWDLEESDGVRYDSRLRNIIRDSAVTNILSDITRQEQNIYGSTQASGDLNLFSTTHATKGKVIIDNIAVSNHSIASNSDSAVVWNRATKAYEVAKINGTTYTFSNGINEASGAVKLGGVLTQPTTISSSSVSNVLSITGVNTSSDEPMLKVFTNGSNGFALQGESSTGRGVYGLSGSGGTGVYGNNTGTGIGVLGNGLNGYGGWFQSTNGTGVYVLSTGVHAGEFTTSLSSTNTTVPILRLYRISTAAAGNNIAGSIEFYLNNTTGAGSTALSNKIISKLTTATAGSEVSQLEINTISGGSGTESRKAALAGNGQWTWDPYGQGTFTVTPATTPVYSSSGVVGERIAPKIYTALISATAGNNPTVTVLGTNEIGSIVWTRSASGNYVGTLTGAFTTNKTWLTIQRGSGTTGFVNGWIFHGSANTINIQTFDNAGGSVDAFDNISFEVRVYP